ncbi:MAG TPA: pilus assembly protein PilP [Burkholderiales bacterium]|nr:pilus assembly protein PilP [Burkholderiales bacterium]
MMRKYLIPIVSCALLAGCSSEKHADLRTFVKDADNLPRGRIPPLPEVKPYLPIEYAAFDLTDPFKPRKIEPPKNTAQNGGIQPDPNRRREPLEAYPLEALKMVGVLKQKEFFGLVKTPDNNLFQVKAGNYLGQNFGRITAVSDSAIKLKEIVQDSNGTWEEKEQTLLLQE